ncbi:MAG: hypothetical protein UZ21_OP11001000672 [Microgenomates bacterium OLB22]|nr:MAG: hypothetical protein UZ21_OP11001000672 [Microgenomates bacterium OLB22]
MTQQHRQIGLVLIIGGTLGFVSATIFGPDLAPATYTIALFASSIVIGLGTGMRFTWEIWALIQRFFGPWR